MRGLWVTRLLDFISPRSCVVCGQRLTATEHSLCSVCLLHLPRTAFQYSPDDNDMAQLFWHLAPVERAAALIYYEPQGEVAQVIYDMKYRNRPDVGEDMGRLMAQEMQQARYFDGIDVLVPVPLSRKRQRQRGYNQSEELARGISDVTRLPVVTTALRRKHFRQSQTHLTRRERQENVTDMFQLRDKAPLFGKGAVSDAVASLRGKHILLIDDICTTGATLLACAHALRSIEGIRLSILTFGFTKS